MAGSVASRYGGPAASGSAGVLRSGNNLRNVCRRLHHQRLGVDGTGRQLDAPAGGVDGRPGLVLVGWQGLYRIEFIVHMFSCVRVTECTREWWVGVFKSRARDTD